MRPLGPLDVDQSCSWLCVKTKMLERFAEQLAMSVCRFVHIYIYMHQFTVCVDRCRERERESEGGTIASRTVSFQCLQDGLIALMWHFHCCVN